MRLATWNVNSLGARMPRVTEWLELQKPDILCMQETKQADDKFPEREFAEPTTAMAAGTAWPS